MNKSTLSPATEDLNSVASSFKISLSSLSRWKSTGILIPFVILFVALSLASSPFLTGGNLLNILDQQSSILIIAGAGTLVLVGGGIDFSVGSTYGLAGVITGEIALHHNVIFAIAVGILTGILIGLINGIIVTYFKINALIATLAVSFVVSGAASRVTSGNLVVLTSVPALSKVATSSILGIRSSIWISIISITALMIVLSMSTTGRYLYATGGNAEAARLAGVRVNGVRILTYVLSGAAASVGGIIDVSRVLSAQASSGGDQLAFTVLAGIVVGGTSIAGGEGTIWRTVLGVLFIALVGNGFDLLGINPLYEQILLGIILLGAVGIDAWSNINKR